MFKKLFKSKKEVRKNMDAYAVNTMTALYFPKVLDDIEKRKKVERFFNGLNTEC